MTTRLYGTLSAATELPIITDRKIIDGQYTADMTFADGHHLLIVIDPGCMIYVAETDYDGLQCLINNDAIDNYESYDLADGAAYFMNSDHALLVIEELLYMSANYTQFSAVGKKEADERRQRMIDATNRIFASRNNQ